MATKKSVRIRDDQDEFVHDHEGFNLSGFLREKLDEEMERRGWEPEDTQRV